MLEVFPNYYTLFIIIFFCFFCLLTIRLIVPFQLFSSNRCIFLLWRAKLDIFWRFMELHLFHSKVIPFLRIFIMSFYYKYSFFAISFRCLGWWNLIGRMLIFIFDQNSAILILKLGQIIITCFLFLFLIFLFTLILFFFTLISFLAKSNLSLHLLNSYVFLLFLTFEYYLAFIW